MDVYKNWISDGRFCALVARFLFMMFFDGVTKSFGVVMDTIVSESNLPYRTVGWILTWQLATCYLSSPIVAVLLKDGNTRVWGVIAGFCVGSGFIGLGYAISISLWLMLAMTSITGFGLSVLLIITVVNLKKKFHGSSDYSKAYAVSSIGTNVGVSLFPLILNFFQSRHGTRNGVTLLGTFLLNMVTVGLLASTGTRSYHEDHNGNLPSEKKEPEDDDGNEGRIPQPSHINVIQKITNYCISATEILRKNPSFAVFLFLSILVEINFVAWAIYLVPYGESLGLPPDRAVLLSTVGGASGLLGKLFVVLVAYLDSLHIMNVFAIPSLMIALSYVATFIWKNFLTLVFASFTSGFCIGLQGSARFSMLGHVVRGEDFTQAVTWLYSGYILSALSGGIISGLLRDLSDDFRLTFIFLTSAGVLNALVTCLWWMTTYFRDRSEKRSLH